MHGEEEEEEEERAEIFMRTEESVVNWVLGFCFMSGNRF